MVNPFSIIIASVFLNMNHHYNRQKVLLKDEIDNFYVKYEKRLHNYY